MEKLKMQSENLVDANIDKISALFPNCVTEGQNENGKPVKLVDFDLLKQELSQEVLDGNDERYTLNWAGKKQAILTSNAPTSKTLRPYQGESVKFDKTNNLYIEGDNLDVLKLLRETYLGKVKLIYIDPPYNTGNDFVYNDDYATTTEEYLKNSKSFDEQGNQLFQNNDSNGRFHSDWLSMMYMRIKLSKDLLTDDGIIFMSIDDNEVANLRKICDEIYGENNFVNCVALEITPSSGVKRAHKEKMYIKNTEYLLVYRKSDSLRIKPLYDEWSTYDKHYATFFDGKEYISLGAKIKSLNPAYQNVKIEHYMYFDDIKKFILSNSQNIYRTHDASKWAIENVSNGEIIYNAERKIIKSFNPQDNSEYELLIEIANNKYNRLEPLSWNLIDGEIKTLRGDLWLDFDKDMGNVSKEGEIPYPNGKKPLRLLTDIIKSTTSDNDIILDFFSGSATTGHAVMQVNQELNSNRKFILIQIPEKIDYTNSDNVKNYKKYGFDTICDLGKERLRIAGNKIIEEQGELKDQLDIGFRVLKLDSSCMKDVYYNPEDLSQTLLAGLEDNIKEDRTPEDLLFQVMLDMGVMLSSEIKTLDINGKKVFNVNDGNLVCCFDKNLKEDVVKEIAKMQPLYAVFRDASMNTDSVNVNFDQIFETYLPTTTRKVL